MTQSTCTRCQRPAELFLCWDCTKALRRVIKQIPWLADQLTATAHGGSALNRLDHHQLSEPRGPVPEELKESPVPWDSRARKAADDLHSTLSIWVRDLCDSAGIEYVPIGCDYAPIGPMREGYLRIPADYQSTTADLARWLGHHFMSIPHSEDAGLCADEIHTVFGRGIDALNPRDRGIYVGPCPTITGVEPDGKTPVRCREALYARREDDGQPKPHVTCWKCRQRHDTAKLRDRAWAQASNFRMNTTDLLRVLDELGEHLPRKRFYEWRKSRAIKPRGWQTRDGRITDFVTPGAHPVFELSEVRALMAREGVST